MKFNEKIVKLRKLKGLTQDELASAVGVSRQAVYKWESGQSYPEVPKLLEMKLLFGISIDDLFDESYEVVLPEKKRKRRISSETKATIEKEVNEELKTEESPVAETKEEILVTAKVEASVSASEEKEADDKKRGFFGRIFGRK